MISLLPIDQSNWRDALDVLVTDDQLRFVADHQPVVLVILAKAYLALGDKRWTPLAIVDDDRGLVGVVALAIRAARARCSISPLTGVINIRGSAPAHWPRSSHSRGEVLGCGHVELTVHPENESAQRLYAGGGFSPTG